MQVIVVEYNPAWPPAFEEEATRLRETLGDLLIDVQHIGSTAVPGLRAKPILDISLEVDQLVHLDTQNLSMQHLGYEVMGEYGIPGRRYFRKGGDQRTHHIHAFASGDPGLFRHLAFRDYLRAHPNIAEAYGQLKWEIAQSCNHDLEEYCDKKDPFVKLHESKALAWYYAQKTSG